MIAVEGSILDKFRLCQELGYDGMELISPADLPADEVNRSGFSGDSVS